MPVVQTFSLLSSWSLIMLRWALGTMCVVIGASGRSALAAEPVNAPPTFNAQVRPLFKTHCFECHGEGEKLKGDLDLRLRRLIAKGGESGPAIVAGKPDTSLLLQRVTSGEMPPGKKKLSTAEIDLLKRWIAAGAKVEAPEPESLAKGFQITDEDRRWWAFQPIRRPAVPELRNPSSPTRNPIDAFLLAKLSEKRLSFASPADRLTLLRRITFDLTGLPPTPVEVDAFFKDNSADAYEKLVERLLASPRYGERWGRHWLDVAGYADSEGGSPEDSIRTTAWKYRDYVIRSFNADKPFDQFIREQLAGDELVKPPYPSLSPEDLDKLIATGFLRTAPDPSGAAGIDQKLARNQVVNDTVKIVSSAFLGVTVGCAQCHNHRYDPIPQTDFYRLRAVLEPAYDLSAWKTPAGREVSLYTDEEKKMAAAVEAEAALIDKDRLKKQEGYIEATFQKELAKLPMEMRDKASAARKTPANKRTADQQKLMQEHPSLNVDAGSLYLYDSKAAAALKKIGEEALAMRKKKPVEQFVRVLTETPGRAPPTFLFNRGDPDQPKDKILPGGLNILDASLPLSVPEKPMAGSTTGRRLAFANWLTDPKQPLTSRAIVNRIWMHHFGKGLVPTPGDFGRLGERPTHPELLDWLAAEFVSPASGGRQPPDGTAKHSTAHQGADAPRSPNDSRSPGPWSIKHLHRLILTSTAYKQASTREPRKNAADPDNKLLGRFPLRRLEAESLRDAMLAVSGKLNSKMFGPPVPVVEDDNGIVIIGKPNRDAAYRLGDESVPASEESRRSVYVQVRRSKPLNVLDTFDWAKAEPNCEARNSSTATPQSLMLMNGSFVMQQAQAFAARVQKEAGTDPSLQVGRAWVLAYGSEPSEKERAAAVAFLKESAAAFAKLPEPPKAAKASPPPTSEMKALAAFCQALLSSNRFLYVD
jgi:mono/diheme cytochrome c family protein